LRSRTQEFFHFSYLFCLQITYVLKAL
jgi:hypothetical protein